NLPECVVLAAQSRASFAGECRVCEERSWPQELRERCDLACGPVGAWPDPVKLRAATRDPGVARSDPDAEEDAEKLAALGHERLACTRAELVHVLTGCVREHHRFLLEQHLRTIEQLEDSVAAFDARIEAALSPFHA